MNFRHQDKNIIHAKIQSRKVPIVGISLRGFIDFLIIWEGIVDIVMGNNNSNNNNDDDSNDYDYNNYRLTNNCGHLRLNNKKNKDRLS